MAEDDFLRSVKNMESNLSGALKEKLIDNINFYGIEEYFKKILIKIDGKILITMLERKIKKINLKNLQKRKV